MASRFRNTLFLLFFLSGFCGLLYQVVWLRMAFASFGVVTPVLSVVLSVFMFGLFAGSWGAGKSIAGLTRTTGLSGIYFYALAEAVIAVGALAVPILFQWGEARLLPTGQTDSIAYLAWSALIIAGSLLPWCIAMGTTFPFMMAFLKEQYPEETNGFSFLYLANVIGAMTGVLITAVVLVELLGFQNTLAVAAVFNLTVAAVSVALGIRSPRPSGAAHSPSPSVAPSTAAFAQANRSGFLLLVLFATGFTSMAMEVVWTRAFAIVLRTQVYSFATLLFTYLLATWLGSYLYRKHLAEGRLWSRERILGWLAVTAFLPVLLNDPRLFLRVVGALGSIFPFCLFLGYLTPRIIDEYSGGDPDRVGSSYAVNILGCILGPLFASYLLLPVTGPTPALVLLALPFLGLWLVSGAGREVTGRYRSLGITAAALAALSLTVVRDYEDGWRDFTGVGEIRRDHTASVISYGEGMTKRMWVNGVGITSMTTITKVMAHLPLIFHGDHPRNSLVICFGMGTTFRSLLSWDIDATAVELVPSVRDAFGYYHDDAKDLLKNPKARVVIDDGRRFLRREGTGFDVITLDPPPPTEAAGSSLLYSEEFYELVKTRLNNGGILHQWLPQTEPRTLQAVVQSLMNQFPYVKIFTSFEGHGHHFIASLSPVQVPTVAQALERMPAGAVADLMEFPDTLAPNAQAFLEKVLSKEVNPRDLGLSPQIRITDDRPYNEYFFLRRTWNKYFPARG